MSKRPEFWHKAGMTCIGMLLTVLIAIVGYAGRTLLQNQQKVIETQAMLVERAAATKAMLIRYMSDHDRLTKMAGTVSAHGYQIQSIGERVTRLERKQ